MLIVDLQAGFNPSPDLIEAIQKAAENYSKIAMTRFTNTANSLFRTVLDWHGDGGALAIQIDRAVILDKEGYGLPTKALQTLKEMDCSEWHICGLETDACVLACAFSLWDAGMRPVIQAGLCDSPLHAEGISIAQRQFHCCVPI